MNRPYNVNGKKNIFYNISNSIADSILWNKQNKESFAIFMYCGTKDETKSVPWILYNTYKTKWT